MHNAKELKKRTKRCPFSFYSGGGVKNGYEPARSFSVRQFKREGRDRAKNCFNKSSLSLHSFQCNIN